MDRLYYLLVMSLILIACSAQAQKAVVDADYLTWSATRRLTAADFRMKLRPNSNMRGSTAMYTTGMNGSVYDLLGKRANNAVVNQMYRPASWLDTSDEADVVLSLRYQQALFDIQEIYARRLRQEARSSVRKILLTGKPDIKELTARHLKDAQQRHVDYTEETLYGTLPEKQYAWEQRIQEELQALQAFQVASE